MTIGILKEPSFEARVSMLAIETAVLIKKNMGVWVESGAGLKAFCMDEEYIKSGVLIKSREDILNGADILLIINNNEIPASLKNKVLVGVYQPLYNVTLMDTWAKQGLTVFSLDMLPRITKAQMMDVLRVPRQILRDTTLLYWLLLFTPVIFRC